jgi:dihydroorotate dehydrogenase
MGFNNDGAEVVAARLAHRARRLDRSDRRGAGRIQPRQAHRGRTVLGVNIGKTKVVPEDDQRAVLADYATSARLLAPYADYLVVNVSSPNTPGLRALQAVDRLVPLCVKIAPDLSDEDVVAVGELARDRGLDGLIATNTTISRDGLRTPAADVEALGAGGLSGPVLRRRSMQVLRLLRDHDPAIAIISVGGVSGGQDVTDRLRAGATLVQAYTGFVYGGPLWPQRVLRGLTA